MDTSVSAVLAAPLSGKPHPEVEAYLKAMAAANLPPIETLPAAVVRQGFTQQLLQNAGPKIDVATVRDLRIPGPGGELPLRLYRPAAGTLPVLLYLHGGGWVIGDLETHDAVCRHLAAASGCAVLAVDYRLAPEHPYPAAVEDTLAALVWLAHEAATLELDPARIAVGGDSAGANLAAVACLEARAGGSPHIAAQVLIYPVTDLTRFDTPSHQACKEGYGLTGAAMVWFRDQYADAQKARGVRISPLHALDLRGLPPALVLTAEFDVLRSEGEAYAERLEAAGVPTRLRRYDGMIHGFVSMAGVLSVGLEARNDVAAWLKATLKP